MYKSNFKPSEVACPFTTKFIKLSDEIKKKISSHKKPRFYEEEKDSKEQEYFTPLSLEKANKEVLNNY